MYVDAMFHIDSRDRADIELMAIAGLTDVVTVAGCNTTGDITSQAVLDIFDRNLTYDKNRCREVGIKLYVEFGLNMICVPPDWERVVESIPRYYEMDDVVGVGEIGLEPKSKNADLALQEVILRRQLEIAKEISAPVAFHTPHTDKASWIKKYIDIIDSVGIDRNQIAIDHCSGDVVAMVLDAGFWATVTVQPWRGVTPDMAASWLQDVSLDRVFLSTDTNTSGLSDPLGVPKTALKMKLKGFSDDDIRAVTYNNARAFLNLPG